MQRLKVDERGYPIPYFVPLINGKYDFRYQDGKKRAICIEYRKCCICGDRLLAKQFWFVCGPFGLVNAISSDYAMHEECARFSIAVCPHLVSKMAARRSTPEQDGADPDPNLSREKPEDIHLVRADKVWTITEQGREYIKFRPIWNKRYTYVENKLIEA